MMYKMKKRIGLCKKERHLNKTTTTTNENRFQGSQFTRTIKPACTMQILLERAATDSTSLIEGISSGMQNILFQ